MCFCQRINFFSQKNVDVLTKSLINEALEWDAKDNKDKAPKNRLNKHLSDINCIQSCGVSLNVWEKKNADGKGSDMYDFTSLMGSDKKLLGESPGQIAWGNQS